LAGKSFMFIAQKRSAAGCLLLLAGILSIQAPWASAQSKNSISIRKAYIGSRGNIHIVLSDGKDIKIPKQKDEVNSTSLVVADDKQSAGWVVNSPNNCCTSYPIPLMLMIYQPGRPFLRLGGGMPVWSWRFRNGGKQVAFYTNTVHGDYSPHYELHSLPGGRLLKKLDDWPDEKSLSWTNGLH
jgi:hypothetical protein